MIVSVGDLTAKCRNCGGTQFTAASRELELDTIMTCSGCANTATYRELLERIGEEAMRRANESLAELKKRSARRRKPKK